MASVAETRCPRCRRTISETAQCCPLCGMLLRESWRSATSVKVATPDMTLRVTGMPRTVGNATVLGDYERIAMLPEPVFCVALAFFIAAALALVPFVHLMGWVLGALTHEMGHSLLAWSMGIPAVPSLSPTGHAASLEGTRILPLTILLWGGFTFAAWYFLEGTRRWIAAGLVLVGYPLLAFFAAGEALRLVGGHLGELTFATICLVRAYSGGFTETSFERMLYAVVGWFVLGANVVLTTGLMFSPIKRSHYIQNGSYGLTNDYLRLADQVLGLPLEVVAAGMTFLGLAVVPISYYVWLHLERRGQA